jgi:hypothetical protein
MDEEVLTDDEFMDDEEDEETEGLTADELYQDLNKCIVKSHYMCRKLIDDVKALGAELDEKIAGDVIDMNNIGDILAGLDILKDCVVETGGKISDVYVLEQSVREAAEEDE